jgi:hypothetical protein
MKNFIKDKGCILLVFALILFGCTKENDAPKEVKEIDVKTLEVKDITSTTAVVTAKLNSSGEYLMKSRGICVNTKGSPTMDDKDGFTTKDLTNTIGDYSGSVSGLLPSTKYYARAYIFTDAGVFYANEISFITEKVNIPIIVSTTSASLISQNNVTSGGNIEGDGTSIITAKGVCWSTTNAIPTIADNKTNDGIGIGTFSSSLTGLSANTKYYARAYATNITGTVYGNVIIFTTSVFILPTVSTTTVSSILKTSAISGGTVRNEGSNPVTQRGICWDWMPNPRISNMHTSNGSGIGSFVSSVTSLQEFKTYYVRAYATSTAGTAYGENLTFKTIGGATPTIYVSVINISSSATSIKVEVLKQGTDNVEKIGLSCYDMNGYSRGQISGGGWSNANVFAPIIYQITKLSSKSKYYVIGSATNGVGTVYSEKVYFTSL